MSEEKIGSSVLGYESSTGLSAKKRKELEVRVKQELAKKKQVDEEEEKLPKLPIPGDSPPEPIPGETDWDEMIGEKGKNVHVEEHYRKKPKKKKQEESSSIEIF